MPRLRPDRYREFGQAAQGGAVDAGGVPEVDSHRKEIFGGQHLIAEPIKWNAQIESDVPEKPNDVGAILASDCHASSHLLLHLEDRV